MGITFDRVTTNPYADMGSITRKMNDFEYKIIQREVDNIYETFSSRVSEGRKLDKNVVKDSIGQGRVWTGVDALELGLIDELGGLEDAIAHAVKLGKLKKGYIVREYPRILNPFEEFILAIGDQDSEEDEDAATEDKIKALVSSVKASYPGVSPLIMKHVEAAGNILQRKGAYTYLPWYTEIK